MRPVSCLLALMMTVCIHAANGQHTKGLYADSLKKVLKRLPETDTLHVEALTRLSWTYAYKNPDSAILLAEKASVFAENIGHYKMKTTALYIIGAVHFIKSDFEKAEDWFHQSLASAHQHHDMAGIRNAYNGLGSLYRERGQYIQAVDNFLALLKEYGGKRDESTALALVNLGKSYRALKEYDLAIQSMVEGYRILDSMKIQVNVQATLRNIGLCYMEKRSYNDAAIYFRKALRLDTDPTYKVEVSCNLGTALLEMDSIQSAAVLIEKGLTTVKTIQDNECKGTVYLSAGKLRLKQNRAEEAITFGKNALGIFQQPGYKEQILNSEKLLAEAYSRQGNYKKAYEHSQKASLLQDSLLNGDITNKISALLKSYEFSKKQAEIDHLSQDATIKGLELDRERNFNYALIGGLAFVFLAGCFVFYSLRTKTRLYNEVQEQKEIIESVNHDLKAQALRAQMNPHFTFNALNSIQSLIIKKDTEGARNYLLKFSELMRSLLNNSEKRWVTLKEEVDTLKLYIELESLRFNGEFNYTINPIVEETAAQDHVPPMVIQPFIENAIIHGLLEKPGEKNLRISFGKKNNQVSCEITDNGIGRTAAANANSWNKKVHESKGIKITEQRLKILNNLTQSDSHIEISDLYDDQKNPSGTKVTLLFPHV